MTVVFPVPGGALYEGDVRGVERLVQGPPLRGGLAELEHLLRRSAQGLVGVRTAHGRRLVFEDQRELRNTSVGGTQAHDGLLATGQPRPVSLQGAEEEAPRRRHGVRVLVEGAEQELVAIPPHPLHGTDEGSVGGNPLDILCIKELCREPGRRLELLTLWQSIAELRQLLLATDLEGPETGRQRGVPLVLDPSQLACLADQLRTLDILVLLPQREVAVVGLSHDAVELGPHRLADLAGGRRILEPHVGLDQELRRPETLTVLAEPHDAVHDEGVVDRADVHAYASPEQSEATALVGRAGGHHAGQVGCRRKQHPVGQPPACLVDTEPLLGELLDPLHDAFVDADDELVVPAVAGPEPVHHQVHHRGAVDQRAARQPNKPGADRADVGP